MTKEFTETIVRHAQAMYDSLEEQSKQEEIKGGTVTVFRGSLTKLYNEMNISRSYYTPVMTLLRENDCIAIIQRGSRSVESVVVLQKRPTEEGMSRSPLTGRALGAKVEARLRTLEKLMGGVDIVAALDNHERRLKAVESRKGGRVSGKK